MKRSLAAAMIGSMVLAAGISAAAAPSVEGGGAQPGNIPAQQVVEQKQVDDLDSAKVEELKEGTVTWEKTDWDTVDPEKYTEEKVELIKKMNKADAEVTVKEAFDDSDVDLKKIKLFSDNEEVEDEDVEKLLEKLKFLSPVWELVFDGVEPTEENPVLCTFTVNNLTEDMKVYMLFDCEEHGWELLEAERVEDSDNQVEVAIHSTSAPAAMVYHLEEEDQENEAGISPVVEGTEAESEEETKEE